MSTVPRIRQLRLQRGHEQSPEAGRATYRPSGNELVSTHHRSAVKLMEDIDMSEPFKQAVRLKYYLDYPHIERAIQNRLRFREVPTSQELEPPRYPVRFKRSVTRFYRENVKIWFATGCQSSLFQSTLDLLLGDAEVAPVVWTGKPRCRFRGRLQPPTLNRELSEIDPSKSRTTLAHRCRRNVMT